MVVVMAKEMDVEITLTVDPPIARITVEMAAIIVIPMLYLIMEIMEMMEEMVTQTMATTFLRIGHLQTVVEMEVEDAEEIVIKILEIVLAKMIIHPQMAAEIMVKAAEAILALTVILLIAIIQVMQMDFLRVMVPHQMVVEMEEEAVLKVVIQIMEMDLIKIMFHFQMAVEMVVRTVGVMMVLATILLMATTKTKMLDVEQTAVETQDLSMETVAKMRDPLDVEMDKGDVEETMKEMDFFFQYLPTMDITIKVLLH